MRICLNNFEDKSSINDMKDASVTIRVVKNCGVSMQRKRYVCMLREGERESDEQKNRKLYLTRSKK